MHEGGAAAAVARWMVVEAVELVERVACMRTPWRGGAMGASSMRVGSLMGASSTRVAPICGDPAPRMSDLQPRPATTASMSSLN